MAVAAELAARSIITTRLINAPRELVFAAWTKPEHLAAWWGPDGFTLTTYRFEMRSGGVWRFTMHGPDGTDYENQITFDEIDPPRFIRYRHGGGDDVEPVSFSSTVTFDAVGEKTRITLHAEFPTAKERNLVAEKYGAVEGAVQTLGRLDEFLSAGAIERGGSDVLVIERRIKAPRDLVWRMLSDHAHLPHWWGPVGFSWIDSTLDFRPGGRFVYGMRSPDGKLDLWGRFEYRDIEAPNRIVYVSGFADATGAVAPCPFPMAFPRDVYNVLTLTDSDGGTQFTLKAIALGGTDEERAGFVGLFESMQGGYGATLDKLDAYLAQRG